MISANRTCGIQYWTRTVPELIQSMGVRRLMTMSHKCDSHGVQQPADLNKRPDLWISAIKTTGMDQWINVIKSRGYLTGSYDKLGHGSYALSSCVV